MLFFYFREGLWLKGCPSFQAKDHRKNMKKLELAPCTFHPSNPRPHNLDKLAWSWKSLMSKGNTSSSMVHFSLVRSCFLACNHGHGDEPLIQTSPRFCSSGKQRANHSTVVASTTGQVSIRHCDPAIGAGRVEVKTTLIIFDSNVVSLTILCPFVKNFDERYSRCMPENIYSKYCIWLG